MVSLVLGFITQHLLKMEAAQHAADADDFLALVEQDRAGARVDTQIGGEVLGGGCLSADVDDGLFGERIQAHDGELLQQLFGILSFGISAYSSASFPRGFHLCEMASAGALFASDNDTDGRDSGCWLVPYLYPHLCHQPPPGYRNYLICRYHHLSKQVRDESVTP